MATIVSTLEPLLEALRLKDPGPASESRAPIREAQDLQQDDIDSVHVVAEPVGDKLRQLKTRAEAQGTLILIDAYVIRVPPRLADTVLK